MNTDTAKISSITVEPTPPKSSSSVTTNPNPPERKLHNASKKNCPKLPVRSSALPYLATEKNIPHLQQFLQQQFATSAFSAVPPFPEMKTPLAHIHLKPDVTPSACHTTIPIPYHWKEQVKASLDADIAKDIITKVPIGTPTTWGSQIIVVPKKDGTPRRTVDLQCLNAHCLHETHHCPSPFQLVCQIPANTYKIVLDAVDGYHAIPLYQDSQSLTAFITEWGRFMYKRIPQGFIAARNIYTRRYDEIIKDIPRKVKCVDHT